jgi:hypothetical protein
MPYTLPFPLVGGKSVLASPFVSTSPAARVALEQIFLRQQALLLFLVPYLLKLGMGHPCSVLEISWERMWICYGMYVYTLGTYIYI